MRTLPLIVTMVFLAPLFLSAQISEQPANAKSPNGDFLVVNVPSESARDLPAYAHFEIQNSGGQILYSAYALDALEGAFSYTVDRVLWSADSHFVAVSIQVARHAFSTFVFRRTDHHFVPLEIQTSPIGHHELGPYCQPESWLDLHRLKLSVASGIRQGDQWGYHFMVQLDQKSSHVRVISRTKTVKLTQ